VPMKRLIRNKATREYFKADGTWTRDTSAAHDFPDIRSVLKTEQDHNLEDVELVLLMGEKPSSYDVTVPLGARKRDREER